MRVGIFQGAGGSYGFSDKLSRLSAAITEHSDSVETKLDLVVCPELFASGYNVGDKLIACAETENGPSYQAFAALARQHDTAFCYGYPQRSGDKIYNAAAFIGADGELLANHRKQLNSPGSFEEDYFTPGIGTTALHYGGINIAVLICYEVEFPESVRNAAITGADLIVVPTALVDQWDVVASKVVPTRAFENGIWIAYANHAGDENGFNYLGRSRIVAPDGNTIVDAGTEENLISAEIDLQKVKAARTRLPYLRDFGKLNKGETFLD